MELTREEVEKFVEAAQHQLKYVCNAYILSIVSSVVVMMGWTLL